MRKSRRRAAYLEADRDVEFLDDDATRGIRLQLEYLKAEVTLERHRIGHTILVMGSTHPYQHGKTRYYEVAREFGRLAGRAGQRRKGMRGAIVTGGGPGLMEAANRGAREVGAPSVGLNISLPHPQLPNPYITPELCLRFRYFALRKLHFLLRARAMVAFPGGYGTFDELFETLCLVQTGKRAALPVVLVGEEFWRRALDFDFLVERGVLLRDELALFAFAESAPEIWEAIRDWYAERHRSIFDEPPADEGSEDLP